ncbi:hypothetical protein Plec18167_009504 [Paecilomyces lecythidis]|uniref:Dienelactone hydrolase domain-containing protein n=1 Tax=Paecilomyces lecythidis TaxID=3004212 RepID=A0ABR3WNJ1_9EURO
MASNPPGACCATGFKHEGNPTGEIKDVGGVKTYFSQPKEKTDKAILILTDIFGIYTNSQLIADQFAENGYLAVIPDLFAGDAIDVAAMEGGKVDLPSWIQKHQPNHVDPIVEASIKSLREQGIKKIGGVGYCFGAKYVTRFLKNGKLDVGYNAHPSFVSHEELAAIQGPLSIAAAEIDQIFTTELRHESEGILIKTGQPWQINLFSGVSHGFAVRADLSKPENKFAKEQAFVQAIAWFTYHL